MNARILTTLLSGYLGSGKTTLINRILEAEHGLQVAVLVNDFGAVNIDARFIKNIADQTISLTNGCVCCSIADDLGAALDQQTARDDPPDHIVIEASGVAEPARIANYASGWPGLRLNSLITLIDAETVQERASDKFVGRVVTRQIEAADLLIVNKLDLIDDAQLQRLEEWLHPLASEITVLKTINAAVEPGLLLGSTPVHSATQQLKGAVETHGLKAITWEANGPINLGSLSSTIQSMPPTIHRLKGMVIDDATGNAYSVQVVARRSEFRKIEMGTPNLIGAADGNGQIVAIGVDHEDLVELRHTLDTIVAANLPAP
ncbi:MAG: GTP-binding protein [Rhodospirillaceae bacterium]|jgi:G3E family GTPase|nr:GTP-binding protein [Rhodospirillaceae bacterium]MBT4085484.1 GTP-binding protein [Alphaproteobacteria bacterium]MBT6218548.1 GTP-binding protein [Rhodospirillaceae bacterium]MBT6588689.1 GTP-binding protein [Rhodospirillaceae bacterium]